MILFLKAFLAAILGRKFYIKPKFFFFFFLLKFILPGVNSHLLAEIPSLATKENLDYSVLTMSGVSQFLTMNLRILGLI